ncbi:MAG: hypothetical protein GXP62_20030 [Oligoflexia bacterium]|nr:hypothetical protein [Oligoflexia bacterium]
MTLTLALLALGCTQPDATPPHTPGFEDINFAVDGFVDIINRVDVLDAAQEETLGGAPLDLSTATDIFSLNITSDEIQALDDPLDTTDDVYSSLVVGVAAAGAVDLALAMRIGAMTNTLQTMQTAAINEYQAWQWSGSKSVTNDQGVTVTAQLNMAWVGTGWLVEVLQTTQDGQYDHTVWFNGYYQADGGLGWWDFYLNGGVEMTMEWLGDRGDGQVEMYWPTGDSEDDRMWYEWGADGSLLVKWSDSQPPPNAAEITMAQVDADQSGQGTLPSYNDSQTACWDANLENATCSTGSTTTGSTTTGSTTTGSTTP